MFVKESLRGAKKRGAAPPPHLRVLKRGHMGSVFAGRMILDVALYSLKKRGGWGGRRPPNLQTDCLHDGTISKRPPQGPEDQGTRDHGTRGPRTSGPKTTNLAKLSKPQCWPHLLKKNWDPLFKCLHTSPYSLTMETQVFANCSAFAWTSNGFPCNKYHQSCRQAI